MPHSSQKCILVDGNSLVYRAFFAIPFLSTRDGQPTNALYGFANMLLKLYAEEKPDLVVVAFDAPAKTFRHDMFAGYKGTRKPTPDELRAQTPLARDVARCLGSVVVEVPGYEADDIVGTCAVQASELGYEVLIVTGDLDELQLVSDRIRVAATTRGVSEVTVYTPEAVVARFGIGPEQFVDFKALKGDTSDNIPGVPGVGDKTASRLLVQFGSVDSLLDRLSELPLGKLRDSLEACREQIPIARKLATIVTDVPLEFEMSELAPHSRPPGEAEQLFRKFEFEALLKRLPVVEAAPAQVAARASEFHPELRRVSSDEEMNDLLHRVEAGGSAGFVLDRKPGGSLAGVAIGLDGEGVYIPLQVSSSLQGDLTGALEGAFAVPLARIAPLFASGSVRLATHDVKSAQTVLAENGAPPPADVDDTMLAGFLLQPGRGAYTVEWLSSQYLDFTFPEKLPEWEESALRAAAVHTVSSALGSALERDALLDVYHTIELPLAPVLARMEQTGVQVDGAYLDKLSEGLGEDIARLQSEICALAGTDFNIGSTKQLGVMLFEKMGLPCGKRTKTGYSTDAETLESLAPSFEIAARILEWRELTKLKSTYADTLPRLADPKTGRLHTTFNQTGAATGRLSSSDPNLQNIPIKTELGRRIRAAFVAPPGSTLVSSDYSQIELRLLAHLSGDAELIRCFTEEEDIHVRTACALFGVSAPDVTPDMRRRAKTINFSVIYGKSAFGLSKELGISVSEATEYIAAYFRQYPRVKEYTGEVLEGARKDGYVTTIFGRKRWFPELGARDRNVRANAERAAFNAPLQGSAADIIKLAMVSLDSLMDGMPCRMVLQVHDELVFEVDEGKLGDVTPVIKREMEAPCELRVPLVVEVKSGMNWRDL